MESIDLDKETLYAEIVELIPLELRERHGVIPVRNYGPKIVVAMVDPSDLHLVDELRFVVQRDIEAVAASEAAIRAALDRTAPVQQLQPHLDAASVSNPASITSAMDAFIYRTIWAGVRFITIDATGVSVWRDHRWTVEATLATGVREALIEKLRGTAQWEDGIGLLATVVARGEFGYLLEIERGERGPSARLELLPRLELEARLAAQPLEVQKPAANPYR